MAGKRGGEHFGADCTHFEAAFRATIWAKLHAISGDKTARISGGELHAFGRQFRAGRSAIQLSGRSVGYPIVGPVGRRKRTHFGRRFGDAKNATQFGRRLGDDLGDAKNATQFGAQKRNAIRGAKTRRNSGGSAKMHENPGGDEF